jgi:two-component system OmpR family sensor kinase
MSLRVRLVAALGLLLTLGLTAFGFGTYSVYARLQHQRLDDELRSSGGFVSHQLLGNTFPGAGGNGGIDADGGDPGRPAQYGTFAALLDSTGVIAKQIPETSTAGQPDIPAAEDLPLGDRIFTLSSSDGSGSWRAYVTTGGPGTPTGDRILIAVPTNDIENSLRRLILVEGFAGLVLLGLLTTGSWLVIRRGLRPLEHMAATAESINAGDLSQRVSPADGRGEVGQLGLALNTMLGGIETSFAERQATEERLRQFLADASHELRTPLTSIRGFAELFRLGADGDQLDRATMVRRIEEESARMKVLVDDLLLLARLDQTRVAERKPVDLAVLAADACTDAVAVDPTRAITLAAPQPVVVAGDSDHLRQAIANLVTNALRHTPAGSPVEVAATWHDGTALVHVRDHGAGLGPDALAHVFDRFWRADEARTGAGAGLGLSIVAAIALEHKGRATADNAPDGGAVFILELPLNDSGHTAASREPRQAAAAVISASSAAMRSRT